MIDIAPGRHSPLNETHLRRLLENHLHRQSQQQSSVTTLNSPSSPAANNNNSSNITTIQPSFGEFPGNILNLPPRKINIKTRNDHDEDDLDSLPPLDEAEDDKKKRSKVESRKFMDYLRGISYTIADTDVPESRNIVQNAAPSFQHQSISSLYVDTAHRADQLWLYNAQIGTANHSYIKSRAATAITIYPLLLSRGIKTIAQLRRISVKDIDFLRKSLCKDSAGSALFAAVLARLQRDATDPSCEGLEIFRPSQVGSGVEVKRDVHHNIGIAQDRRPEDHALPWHRKRTEFTVVCKECAPAKYRTDVESRIEKEGNGIVCPQPPWVLKKKKQEQQLLLASQIVAGSTVYDGTTDATNLKISNNNNNNNINSDRLFDPKPNIRSGRMFVPRLTTLQHQLLPSNILPEESDEITWNQKKDRKKVKMNVGDAKTLNDLLMGGNAVADSLYDDQENYDPFRCRAAMTFTFDEVAVTTKLLNAVKEVVENAYIRAGSQGPEPFVDATTSMISASVLGQTFASMGVEPRALAAVTSAVNRGRLGSVMFSPSNSGRRSISGSTTALLSPNSTKNMTSSMRDRQNSVSMVGRTTSARGQGSFAAGRRTSTMSNTSSRGGGRSSPPHDGAKPSSAKGVTISDLVAWIEQKLDAPRFLKQIFTRFSRCTPWIIFRYEMDEAIRSRVTGINLILQIMNESNVDILPFERFASEVSKGKTSIAFSQQFIADAIRSIAENPPSGRGGLGSRKSSAIGGGGSLRRAGSSTVSNRK